MYTDHENNRINFIFSVVFFIFLSHYLAVFSHEYCHSLMAWLLGYKTNPWLINYGGDSWHNLLLLSNIDEKVDYSTMYAASHPYYVSLVAFAGPGIGNGTMFTLSFFLLRCHWIKFKTSLFHFLFWFNLMNLGNFYDYIPQRTFYHSGDIKNFITGLNISAWWVYIIGGYLVAFLIWQFLTKTLTSAYIHLKISSSLGQASLMIVAVLILFGFFGGFPHIYFMGEEKAGVATYLFSATSFLAIPGIITALWPTRSWVKQATLKT